jgi:hypothetical protein
MQIEKKHLMYGVAAVAVVLLLIAVTVYLTTGETVVAGGAGTAATLAAGEALRRRQQVRNEVEEAKKDTQDAAGRVVAVHDKADADMKAEADKVGLKSDDEKVADGNDLFG